MEPSIFKAYDIRGLSPGELDEDSAFRIGQALVELTKAEAVVVGKDMRMTTPSLFAAFVRGACSRGADVVDIGMVTTPMFYFGVGQGSGVPEGAAWAGAMITASHNPSQYNGIKLCYGDVLPIGAESGMPQIRDVALAGPLPELQPGRMTAVDIRDAYLDKVFAALGGRSIGPLTVVVDGGNGMEGVIIEALFARLPQLRFEGLFLEPDGNFPNHEANPLKEETLDAVKAKIREVRADVGFAFDGDGDRVGVIDEQGTLIAGDLVVALLAPGLLRMAPGAAVLFDVRSSWVVPEEVGAAGGRPVMCRVGHGLIKPQMRKEGAVFAGELSDHFYFRDLYGAESSDLVMLSVLALMSEAGKPLSELVAPLRRYVQSGEINSEVIDKAAAIARVEAAFGKAATEVSRIDGIRMEFRDPANPEGDWWCSVRQSNTEPLLRLNVEARTRQVMEEKRDALLALLRAA